MFDISKAFDKVWHEGLLYKLHFKVGVPAYILQFMKNFLENRSFKIKIGKHHSDVSLIQCGVPQGSVLGPLLFLYI